MKKIKPLAKKHRFRRWLRRLFGIKPKIQLAGLDEMHNYFLPWTYIHNVPIRTAPVTCILKCTACGVHIPRAAGVNYHFCPNCGARKTDRYEMHKPRPDGRTIAQTIIDEVPPTDFQKKAIDYLKEVAPGLPNRVYEMTAKNLETLKAVSHEEHSEIHQSYKS